jgi:hypothetical protein
MTVTTGGAVSSCSRGLGGPAGRPRSGLPCAALGGVAQLLDHQHRRVLVDRLVDGGHDAHVHQHLDDFGGLDGHLLRQLGDRDGLADLFGLPARLFLRALAGLLFLDQAPVRRFQRFALAPLGLGLLARSPLRLLGFAPLRIDLFLLRARLFLEHIALDVGALDAHLDVDGARPALGAGQLQFALRLALERDARRRRAFSGRTAAVAAAQVRQQLELRVLADQAVGPATAMPAWSSCASSLSTGTFSASAN